MSFVPYVPTPYVPPVFGAGDVPAPTGKSGFWHGLGKELKGTVTGFIPGAETLAGAVGSDLVHHSIITAFAKAAQGKPDWNLINPLSGQIYKKGVRPAIKGEETFWSHPLRNVEQGQILTPIIDALTIASLGGGRIAAVGLTGKEAGAAARAKALATGRYQGAAKSITTTLPSGETQVLKDLPRSGYRAAKAIAGEKVKRTVFGEEGAKVGGKTVGRKFSTTARAAKAQKVEENKHILALTSDPRVVEWQNAFKKLSVNERIAFHVKSRLPIKGDLETWKGVLQTSDQPAAQQALKLIDRPKVMQLYENGSPRLDRVMNAWKGITDARQEILLRHGAIDPFQIEEGSFRHTLLMRGAQVLTKSKAYNSLRAVDAELNKLEGEVGKLPKQGKKIGQKEIRQQIQEGRSASATAMKSSTAREKYRVLGDTTDKALNKARVLREKWNEVSRSDNPNAETLATLQEQMDKAYNDYEAALEKERAYAQAAARRGVVPGEEAAARQVQAAQGVRQAREARISALQGLRAQYHELIDARHEAIAHKMQVEDLRARVKAGKAPLVGGPTTEALRQEYKAAGVPEPGYVPDVPASRKSEYITTGEGSIGPPRPQADVYATSGVMFRHGIIDLVGDHITAAFFRAAKHERQIRLHEWAMRVGRKVPKGDPLPDGYEWVRKYRGQRIPSSETAQAEHMRAVHPFDGLNEDEFDQITGGKELTPDQIATIDKGNFRVAVPKSIADQFRADFTRGATLGSKLLRNATNVWRSLLLKTRISWLENNIIGNTILASIRFAGVSGLKAFLSLVGPAKARELMRLPVTRSVFTDAEWAQLFPEALRGTHIETQLPRSSEWFGGTTKASEIAGKGEHLVRGAFNLLPRADRWYESYLRKGGILTTLRQQPEVRALYKAQAKGSKSWRQAMLDGIEQNPHLQRLAVKEVGDSLGDFLSMSKIEREQIRQLIPFYAWFREIVRITGKIVVDTPGRAKVVQLIGQVGAESQPQDVPSYLQGGIRVHLPSWLGGSADPTQQTIIATRSMNPLSSVLDVGQGFGSLLQSGPQAPSLRPLTSELNPFLAAILSPTRPQRIGANFTRAPILQPLVQTLTNLPQYRVGFAPSSGLYPTRTRWDQLFQSILGSPVRTYDIAEAANRVGQ